MPSLYIVLEQEVPGLDATSVNGKALSESEERLDEIARSLHVTPLMEFHSIDPEEEADMIESCGGDLSTVTLPPLQWFEARDGLLTVQALRDYLTQNPDALPNTSAVEEDLAACERVLEAAQEKRLGWRLAVDF